MNFSKAISDLVKKELGLKKECALQKLKIEIDDPQALPKIAVEFMVMEDKK